MARRPQARSGAARRGRLSRSAEFDRVFRDGRSHANRYLVLHSFPRRAAAATDNPELDASARLGLSVSRKVGGAVERNRVKRLLREAFRAMAPELDPGVDVVLVARPDVGELARTRGLAGVAEALGEVVEKSGLRREVRA